MPTKLVSPLSQIRASYHRKEEKINTVIHVSLVSFEYVRLFTYLMPYLRPRRLCVLQLAWAFEGTCVNMLTYQCLAHGLHKYYKERIHEVRKGIKNILFLLQFAQP